MEAIVEIGVGMRFWYIPTVRESFEQGIALNLMGPIALRREGVEIALPPSKKTRALLGYLAATGRPARRDHLCSLLWEIPDDPRGALRWSLSKLRAHVDEPQRTRLITERETVALDCSDIAIDWVRLRELATADVRKAELTALEECLGATWEFLEDTELPACEGFQAWLVAMREDTRRWQVVLLREMVGRFADPVRALDYARRWCELDPYEVIARSTLIDLLERCGRVQEADQQRTAAVRVLDDADIAIPSDLRRRPKPASVMSEGEQPAELVQHVRFCVARDGTGLAYSTVGEGLPLVKTANWLNHLEYDFASPVWQHWIRELASYRSLIRYDERGNGLSDWNVKDICFDAFVDDLSSVADAAALDRFDLFGVSQGCSVAIAYAVRNPDRVGKLVLYGGYPVGWKVRGTAEEVEMRQAMITLTRSGWGRNNPAFRQMFTSLFFPDLPAEGAEWFNELQRKSASAENAVRLQEAFGVIDVRKLLPQVSVPTLVLHTNRDAVVPFTAGRALATAIPGAQFVQLESCNHLVLESDPAWPRASEAIRTFLES